MKRDVMVLIMVVLCLGVSSAYADLILNDGGTHDIAGFVSGDLYVYDNVAPPPTITTVNLLTTANIHESLHAYDNSVVNVHDGLIGTFLCAHDTSTVNINGGWIPVIQSDGSGVVNMYGGSTILLDLLSGTANIYGGSIIGDLWCNSFGVVNVYGVGFNYPYGPITATSGTLTGTLYMSDALSVDFLRFGSGTINLIERAVVPAPGALVLGAIGLSCAGWRLRRRSS